MGTPLAWSPLVIHPLVRTPEIQVILLDCSESMRPFEDVVISTFGRSLTNLQRSKRAYRTFLAVIGFGTSMTSLVDFSPVACVQPLRRLAYSNGTRLVETVYDAMSAGIALCDGLLREGRPPKFTLSVMTDGYDNVSHPQYERRLRRLAAEARDRPVDYCLYAFGVSAPPLARILGSQISHELVPSAQSIAWTLDSILRV